VRDPGTGRDRPEAIRIYDTIENTPGGYDYIVISVKTTANADIAESLAGREEDILSPEGCIVLFQNGYGNEQAYIKTFNKHLIYHASFAIGFKRPEPHVSEATVITAPVTIGNIFGFPAEKCKFFPSSSTGAASPAV
jgi:2-dehydropantoate 2-reductase